MMSLFSTRTKSDLVTMRKTVPVANGINFSRVREVLSKICVILLQEVKMLLRYHGDNSHMTLRVSEIFHDKGTLVYSLPVHTPEKTQPLVASLFGILKEILNATISQ